MTLDSRTGKLTIIQTTIEEVAVMLSHLPNSRDGR